MSKLRYLYMQNRGRFFSAITGLGFEPTTREIVEILPVELSMLVNVTCTVCSLSPWLDQKFPMMILEIEIVKNKRQFTLKIYTK